MNPRSRTRRAGGGNGSGQISSVLFMVGALAVEFTLAAAAWWLAPRLLGHSITEALSSHGWPLAVGYGLVVGLGGVAIVVVAYASYPRYWYIIHAEVIVQLQKIPATPLAVAGVAAAFGEELFFRGLLLPWMGLLPSSLLFGVLHVSPGESWVYYGATTTVIGLGLGGLFLAMDNLLACMVAHVSYNVVVTVLIFAGFFDTA